MNITPTLNLNRHPKDCKDYSLVDAKHMIISKDSQVLTTENSIINNDNLNTKIKELVGEQFTIIYAIPCNKEIVFFVSHGSATTLVRYNEDKDAVQKCCDIDYTRGRITGTFTYNKNHLIITYSIFSYNEDINKPLYVIDLNEFGKPVVNYNTYSHPACPEVLIPECKTEYINGNAYKGWYYIFVRYKISNQNYTQWYNTNKTIFVDVFQEDKIEDVYTSANKKDYIYGPQQSELKTYYNIRNWHVKCGHKDIKVTKSDDSDIANISFKIIFNNLDTRYTDYQIGFINIRTDSTKCFRTADIKTSTNYFNFNKSKLLEDSVINLITSYNNYYNVKTLDSYNNLLYIANYNEYYKDNELFNSLKSNKLTINLTGSNITDEIINPGIADEEEGIRFGIKASYRGVLTNPVTNAVIFYDNNYIFTNGVQIGDTLYLPLKDIVLAYGIGSVVTYDTLKTMNNMYFNDNDIIEFYAQGHTYKAYAKDIKYVVNQYGNAHQYVFKAIDKNYPAIINVDKPAFSQNFIGAQINNIYIISVNGKELFYDDKDTHAHYYLVPYLLHYDSPEHIDDNTTTSKPDESPEDKPLTYNQFNYILNSNCIKPNEYYNLFIHFVDKYGNQTKGFQLFDIANVNLNNGLSVLQNNIGNILIKTADKCSYINVNVDKIPEPYIGYFISYEKFEKHIKHVGHVTTIYYTDDIYNNGNGTLFKPQDSYTFYSDSIDVDLSKSIDFRFDTIRIFDKNKRNPVDYKITDKKLLIANNYNNISRSTNINIKVDNYKAIEDNTYFIAYLVNTNVKDLYISKNKTLIPCTKIIYNNELGVNVNVEINNAFFSNNRAFIFNKRCIWDDAQKQFNAIGGDIFGVIESKNSIYGPIYLYPYIIQRDNEYLTLPIESYQFNNKPQIVVFPLVATEYEEEKMFAIGCVTTLPNTIDLYNQKNVTVYDMYPKVYQNYIDEDDANENNYYKTIRKSNVIQDESLNIGWRFFETDAYKNIIENKGNIIKLTSIGNIMFVHTEHSMFQFRADAGLKSDNGDNIAVGANDIWDIPYQEVLTSELGYAGINDLNHAIVGPFGYIFYEQDKKRFFKFDNGNIRQIDVDVNNFIRRLDDKEVFLLDDGIRDRILISVYNNKHKETISYNYRYNTFVSRHDYDCSVGFATKNKIYLVDYNNPDTIKNFDDNNYNNYGANNESYLSILVNTQYPLNKMLEYIRYRVTKLDKSDELIIPRCNQNGFYYPGETLEIFSEECNTGLLDIYCEFDNNLNSVRQFDKPYRELGCWNYNLIRNNINSYPVKGTSDTLARFYGNWFVVKFRFTTKTANNDCIEFETLDCVYSKNLT